MRTRTSRRVAARYKWDRLKVSFWFAPLIMSLGAILLARAMFWVDGLIPNEMLETSSLVITGSVDELRGFLFSMATTTLTTAGIVFTLLTLPLSTVAAQYGSRLLRVFLGDRITQFVLGMFVATFVYCLAAATSVPPAEIEPDAPQLTTTIGMYLMLATFASLVLLVQHISTMLQAPNIAAGAGAELLEVVRAEIPEVEGRNPDQLTGQERQDTLTEKAGKEGLNTLLETEGRPIRVGKNGYIQYIDPDTLLSLAREKDLVILLRRKPGHFVRQDGVVADIWPASKVNEGLEEQIRRAFQIGNSRTPTQDIIYAVNQLVEMAVRAMSPAINDPFTAMTCLDHIGDGLALFIRHGEKSSLYYDLEGRLRLVLEPVTFEELLSTAFDMLRHCSCDNASVLLRMLSVIESIGQETKTIEARQKLLLHVNLIQVESQAGALIEADRQRILRSSEALVRKLSG